MVRITDYKNVKKEDGKDFNMLIVQGGIESLVSKKTGRIYFTMRKANVTTTFDETTCKSLIGTELPGTIQKINCEPYEYTVEDTGEVLTLTHNWQYIDPDVINADIQIIKEELVN
ncbi:MAG: hypothetical protein REI96_03010 [Flavobacterium nitrogenifigens]|uniref:hypothetical protein n=1 Tax=Flavobacterium nitrogenifigens TaxID=1617283 RepID=UPI0028083216|nr:hypothetical protein [Flavobacterium nitrogenifigens]MDQ8011394.1 hypothetical protein [Flavobacterium nitrogenifigens]